MACDRSCTDNVVGDLDENVLDVVPNCSLFMDGKEQQGVMVTSPEQEREVEVTGWGECALTLLVVGGGGRGSGGGGGGSGLLEYRSLQVTPGTVLTAMVGDQQQASSLAIRGGDTVTAQPGQDGQDFNDDGGSGYCGGGGGGLSSAGDGGTDGGDGKAGSTGSGGKGSGQDVSLYTFTTWSLTPGAGGRVFSYYGGGGGGGVMVDGAGPEASQYQGQGYGGGGNGYGKYGEGLPGLILMEFN